MACAALSLAVAPLIFGLLGVAAGMVAVWKGALVVGNGRGLG